MVEELKLLADYLFGKDSKVKVKEIWKEEVSELFENDNIKKIYEFYTKKEPGAWYYIISKSDMRFIVTHKLNDINTKMMMQSFICDKEYEEVESSLLSIIYNYDNLPVKKKSNCCTIKVLASNGKYTLVEEKIGDIKYYPILIYGVPVYDCKTTNLIVANNMYFNDFFYRGREDEK